MFPVDCQPPPRISGALRNERPNEGALCRTRGGFVARALPTLLLLAIKVQLWDAEKRGGYAGWAMYGRKGEMKFLCWFCFLMLTVDPHDVEAAEMRNLKVRCKKILDTQYQNGQPDPEVKSNLKVPQDFTQGSIIELNGLHCEFLSQKWDLCGHLSRFP